MTNHTHIRIQFLSTNVPGYRTCEVMLPIATLSLVESAGEQDYPNMSMRYHAMTPTTCIYEITKEEYDRLALKLAGADEHSAGERAAAKAGVLTSIKEVRYRFRLTQTALALMLGISQQTLAKYEAYPEKMPERHSKDLNRIFEALEEG